MGAFSNKACHIFCFLLPNSNSQAWFGENVVFLIDGVLCNYCNMRVVASFFPTYRLVQFFTIFFLTSTSNVKRAILSWSKFHKVFSTIVYGETGKWQVISRAFSKTEVFIFFSIFWQSPGIINHSLRCFHSPIKLENHGIIEWLGLEGILKILKSQLLLHGQTHLSLDQVTRSPSSLVLNTSRDWESTASLETCSSASPPL